MGFLIDAVTLVGFWRAGFGLGGWKLWHSVTLQMLLNIWLR
jgi:hypothetical protein